MLANFDKAAQFSRKTWGLLSLELWHQAFHDQAGHYHGLLQGQEEEEIEGVAT